MNHEEEELQVFRKFAIASGLPIELDSIRKEKPQRPDITCVLDDDLCCFELTRLSDQDFANHMGFLKSPKGPGSPAQVSSYSSSQSIREAIEKKAGKEYDTQERRFDLLIYFDGERFPDICMPLMRDTLLELSLVQQDRWETIWFFDPADEGMVLWPERREHE